MLCNRAIELHQSRQSKLEPEKKKLHLNEYHSYGWKTMSSHYYCIHHSEQRQINYIVLLGYDITFCSKQDIMVVPISW